MIQYHMTKQELQSYPKAPLGDKTKQAQIDYVLAIISGDSKEEAYARYFPDRYSKIKGNQTRVRSAIYALENGDYVSGMMRTANKQAYSRFFGKVDKVLQKVYDIAMDDNIEVRDSLSAANTFMKHVPKAPEEIDIKVEVDVGDQYKKMLEERHKYMLELANKDYVDVEVLDDRKE